MTDKTKDEVIAEILQKSLETAQKAGDFVVEQTPDLIQQLILYKTMVYGVSALAGLIVVGLFAYMLMWILRAHRFRSHRFRYLSDGEKPSWKDRAEHLYSIDFEIWGSIPTFAIGAVGIPLLLYNIFAFLKITMAPKVWLLEYTVQLIK